MAYRKGDMRMCAAINTYCSGVFGRGTYVRTDNSHSNGKWCAKTTVTLHGHEIACLWKKDGAIIDWKIDTCGYSTDVTLRRINAFVHLCLGLTSVDFKRRSWRTVMFWCGRDMGEHDYMNKTMYDNLQVGGAL